MSDHAHVTPAPPPQGSLTYGAYLMVPELLALQRERSSPTEHDEMLFIIIHQVYELWFKLVLHELDKVVRDLEQDRMFDAIATIRRVRTVLKTLVGQLDVLETMTPLEFASFRARLDMASGFQSAQFREFEFLLGHKRKEMLKFYPAGSDDRAHLERRLQAPSLVVVLYRFLAKRGVPIPAAWLARDVTLPTEPCEEARPALLAAYRTEPELVLLLESLTDVDEGVQEWRYRHVKMVERTIGAKMGTGGSAGAEYLRATLFRPLFPDLWAIRSQF